MSVGIIFNEEKYTDEILEGCHKYLGVATTSKYLVRKFYKNYTGEKELKLKILEELDKLFTECEIIKDMKLINKNVKKFSKEQYKLKVSKGLSVTKSELNSISGLNNNHLELLAFSLLIMKKIDNFKRDSKDNYINREFRDYYKKMTNDKGCMKRQNGSLRSLENNGLLKFPSIDRLGKTKGIYLEFIDHEGETELLVEDVREIPLIYKKWKGGNIINCEKCNRMIESQPNKLYCDKCAKEINIQKTIENRKKGKSV